MFFCGAVGIINRSESQANIRDNNIDLSETQLKYGKPSSQGSRAKLGLEKKRERGPGGEKERERERERERVKEREKERERERERERESESHR